MVKVNDFIKHSIEQIKQGVVSANEKNKGAGYYAEMPQFIDLDLAVTQIDNEIYMADFGSQNITRMKIKVYIVHHPK